MKVAWFILILLISTASWAFEYQLEEGPLLHPSILDAHELKETFKKHGLNSLSNTSLINAGLPYDQVYVSHQWEKSLILKAGLAVPQEEEGKIMVAASLGVHVFHFRMHGTPYMLMAIAMSEDEFKSIVRPWLKNETVSFFSLLVPSAYAQDCDLPQTQAQALHATAASMEKGRLLTKIGQCSMAALKGAKHAATDTLDFFKKLATDPSALWTETKTSFLHLKELVMNIQSELHEAFKNFNDLDLSLKLDLACSLTGSLVLATVRSLAGGAALARILPGLVLKLKQSSALLARLGNLKKKGIKLPDNQKMVREVISCVP